MRLSYHYRVIWAKCFYERVGCTNTFHDESSNFKLEYFQQKHCWRNFSVSDDTVNDVDAS